MSDFVKDIRDLSSEIDNLKSKIASLDKQISTSESVSKKLEGYFSSAKVTNSGALEIKGLERAVASLTERYNALASAQDAYREKQIALTDAIRMGKEMSNKLADAQREALMSGDQKGASEMYKQFVETNKSVVTMEQELAHLKSSLEVVNAEVEKSNITLSRYETVLAAVKDTDGSINIDKLNNALREQQNDMIQLTADMKLYVNQIKELQEKIKENKLTPEKTEEAKEKIEELKNKVKELGERYEAAAKTAQDLSRAAGKDPNNISLNPNVDTDGIFNNGKKKPKLAGAAEGIGNAAAKTEELSKNALDATKNLEDIVQKGLKIGGLAWGVDKIIGFGKQIMAVRGEFQKLEVAFTTLLGSEQKANKLMQQLTKTAATTPFDLRSVSDGAKKLLAYGTAASDVNDILIHLGDIAAGLSQPLDGLVYLYGTTMVQGKMMMRDLRQFQNRGIPIAEQLAKQFGVAKSEVEGLVSSGRVTADEFHKAIMGMASDGGKFGGLMAAQSKTISGQISNIKDSIEMMFNEIGESSEGFINKGLEGVSKLVENYESVGRVVAGLAAAYGTYRTALIVTTALEQAAAKAKKVSLLSNGAQISASRVLTASLWKQVKAQLAANKAALSNPYVMVAAAIAAVVFVLINWNKWMEKSVSTAAKVNKQHSERVSKINEEISAAEEHIAVLEDETAAYYKVMQAQNALNSMEMLRERNINVAGMSPQEIRRLIRDIAEQENAELEADSLARHIESIAEGKVNFGFESERTKQASINDKKAAVIALTANEYEEYRQGKTESEVEAWLREQIAFQNEIIDTRKARLEEAKNLDSTELIRRYGQHRNGTVGMKGDWEYEQRIAELYKENYNQILQNIAESRESASQRDREENTGISLNEIIHGYMPEVTNEDGTVQNVRIKGIIEQEEEVKRLRAAYAAKASAVNKRNLEDAENTLKDLTEKYKLATGETWTSTEEMTKKNTEEMLESSRKNLEIKQQEYSKRVQLATKYQQDIEDLEREEREWRKNNQGRELPEYFEKKREVIELQFEFDTEKLDKELSEYLKSVERSISDLNYDADVLELETIIETEVDYTKKLEARIKLREMEIKKIKEEGDLRKKNELEGRFGESSMQLYNEVFVKGRDKDEVIAEHIRAIGISEENRIIEYTEVLNKLLQDINNANEVLDQQTALEMNNASEKHRSEDLVGVYSEYYALGEGLANYTSYMIKKESIANKYNKLIHDAELVEDEDMRNKMLKTFKEMKEKELNELEVMEKEMFLSLVTTNGDGSEMSIAERLLGKNGNVKLLESIKLLRNLKKARKEVEDKGSVSEKTKGAINKITGLSNEDIENIAQNTEQIEDAWNGVRGAIVQSVAELGNIDTGNKNLNKVLLGIGKAAELASDETSTMTDKLNGSISIISNSLGGAFSMVAETLSMIGDAAQDPEIKETAEVFGGIAQNFSAAAQGAATGGWIGAIVGGVTDALGQIINAVIQNKQAVEEARLAYQQWADAAMGVRYKQSMETKNNIFGEDRVERLKNVLNTLQNIKNEYLSLLNELEEATSETDAEHLKNLLDYKAALIASIVTLSISVVGLTNAQLWMDWKHINEELDKAKDSLFEVLVGGYYKSGKQNIDGFIEAVEKGYSALQAMQIKTVDKSGSRKDEYKALLDLAPDIFNPDGSINTEMLDAFLQAYGDKLTAEQRMLLEKLKTQQDAYNEAFEQTTEYYSDLFSSVGGSLMESFENEMMRGEDALDSFTESVGEAVEEWVRQFAYMAYIQPYLEQATSKVEEAIKKEGATTEDINNAMDEALAIIFENYEDMQSNYTNYLEEARAKYGDLFGLDLFQNVDSEGSEGFGQMTQDQADTLTARFTAVQIEMANVSAATQAMATIVAGVGNDIKLGIASVQSLLTNSSLHLLIAQDQLAELEVISSNTAMLSETNRRLKTIEANTSRL